MVLAVLPIFKTLLQQTPSHIVLGLSAVNSAYVNRVGQRRPDGIKQWVAKVHGKAGLAFQGYQVQGGFVSKNDTNTQLLWFQDKVLNNAFNSSSVNSNSLRTCSCEPAKKYLLRDP